MTNYFATNNAGDWKLVSSRQVNAGSGDSVGNLSFREDSPNVRKTSTLLGDVVLERYGIANSAMTTILLQIVGRW